MTSPGSLNSINAAEKSVKTSDSENERKVKSIIIPVIPEAQKVELTGLSVVSPPCSVHEMCRR